MVKVLLSSAFIGCIVLSSTGAMASASTSSLNSNDSVEETSVQIQETLVSDTSVSVVIDDTKQSYAQPPVIQNGTTLVPLRGIFETLGAKVDWNQATQTVTATKDATTVKLTIGSKTATVNGKSVALAVPAQIMNGSTMVPLRFISESLGAKVDWNPTTYAVTIQSNGVATPQQPAPQKPAESGQQIGAIKVLHGNHTYGSKNQAEYDAVMKVIKDKVANVSAKKFENNFDSYYQDYLDGARWDGNKSNGSERNRMLYAAEQALGPLQKAGVAKSDIIKLYNLSLIPAELDNGSVDPKDGSPSSAYDTIFRKVTDCDPFAQVASAVFDQAGYSTFIEAGNNHADALVIINGKVYYISTGELVSTGMTFAQYKAQLGSNYYLMAQPTY